MVCMSVKNSILFRRPHIVTTAFACQSAASVEQSTYGGHTRTMFHQIWWVTNSSCWVYGHLKLLAHTSQHILSTIVVKMKFSQWEWKSRLIVTQSENSFPLCATLVAGVFFNLKLQCTLRFSTTPAIVYFHPAWLSQPNSQLVIFSLLCFPVFYSKSLPI